MNRSCKKCGEEITTAGKLCADCSLKLERRLRGESQTRHSPFANTSQDSEVVTAKAIAHAPERIGDTTIKPTERDVITPMLKGYLYWMTGGFIISFPLLLIFTFSILWREEVLKLPSLVFAFGFTLIASMLFAFVSGVIGALVGDSKFAAWAVISILALTFAIFVSNMGFDMAFSSRK